MPGIFRVNLGQRGLAFPTDHAYFDGMPPEVYEQGRRYFPYDRQFDILDTPEELPGILRQHFMAETEKPDYARVYKRAVERLTIRQVIDIMPNLPADSYPVERRIIFPDAKPGMSPDLRIAGTLTEEKGSLNSRNTNNIKHSIDRSSLQADFVIISLSQKVNRDELERLANSRFIDHKDLKVVEYSYEGETIRYERGEFIKSQSQ